MMMFQDMLFILQIIVISNFCVQGEPDVVLTDVEYLVNKKENSGIIILSSLHTLCLWKFNEQS